MQPGLITSIQYPCLPKHFGKVIGVKGKTIQALTQQSGARIHVPSRNSIPSTSFSDAPSHLSNNSHLTITGTRSQIDLAIQLLEPLLQPPPKYTHFVALMLPTPAKHPELHASLRNFQSRSQSHFSNTDFQFLSPTKLHLTLCMLELNRPELLERACQLLLSIQSNRPLQLKLNRLDSFRENASAIHACVDTKDESLNELATQVIDVFYKAGLLSKQELPQYHVTLLRGYCSETSKNKAFPVPSFEPLLPYYPITSWFQVPHLALCKRQTIVGPEGTPCYFIEKQIVLPSY